MNTKTLNIEGTKTSVVVFDGDIMNLAVQQDALLTAFNPAGNWNGAIDNLLYRSPAGVRNHLQSLRFGQGKSSIFHDQLRELWMTRRALAPVSSLNAGEIFLTKMDAELPFAKKFPFRRVAFMLDPVFDEKQSVIPLEAVLLNSLEAIMTVDEVTHVVLPLIRSGMVAQMSGLSREANIETHAYAFTKAAQLHSERQMAFTLVFYQDPLGPEIFAKAVEAFTR